MTYSEFDNLDQPVTSAKLTSAKRSAKRISKKQRRSQSSRRRRLQCESLEARRVLTAYIVTTLDDPSDLTATDGQVSLREALEAANTNAPVGDADAGDAGSATGADTITFAAALNGLTIALANGQLDISDDVNISLGDAESLTIDAGGSSRVLSVTGGGPSSVSGLTLTGGVADSGAGINVGSGLNFTLDGVTIEDNVATGAAATQGGGGIYNEGSTLTITDSVINNNQATGAAGSGGGVFNFGGTVDISAGTAITNNTANRAGGGIEATAGSTTNLTGVTLDNNTAGPVGSAAPGNGGGFHISGNGNASITDGTVNGNTAALEGGGLWNGSGTMTVDGTTLSNNVASGPAGDDGGGAIFNNGGTLNVTGATLTGNAADGVRGSGGGIMNIAVGTVNVTNSTISGNTAAGSNLDDGGGAILSASGSVTIIGSTLSGNSATGSSGSGGAILARTGTLTVSETTISGNTANRAGGGIELGSATASLTNVILGGVNESDGNSVAGDDANPGNGGGLHTTFAANVTITGGSVQNNSAIEGGGLWNSTGTMTIDGTTITVNTANGTGVDQGGGGIFNNGGTVEATNLTLSGNFANALPGSGGGATSDGGTFNISGSTIENNDLFGVWLIKGASGTIVNNSFSGNETADVAIQGTDSDDTFTVNATSVSDGTTTTTIDGTVGLLAVGTLDGADTVNITASPDTEFLINGGDPSTMPGDTLNLDAQNNFVTESDDTLTVSGSEPITQVNFETVNLANVLSTVVEADAAANNIEIIINGENTDVIIDGTTVFSQPTANIPELTINGNDGDDTLTVDYGGGIVPVPLSFDGGDGNDTLAIDGGDFTTITSSHTSASAGQIDLDGSLVAYTGLEPVLLNVGSAADIIFNLPSGPNPDVVIGDDGFGDDPNGNTPNTSAIDGSTFEYTEFTNPSNSLTVNLGTASNTTTLRAMDPLFSPAGGAAAFVINGDSAIDVTNVQATTAGIITRINSGNSSDIVNVSSNAPLNTGTLGRDQRTVADRWRANHRRRIEHQFQR